MINPIRLLYIEYFNNFLTVECFAEYYGISYNGAVVILNEGMKLQEQYNEQLEKERLNNDK